MNRLFAFAMLLAISSKASACSISLDVPLFQPSPLPKNVLIDYAHLASIPSVTARVISVQRSDPTITCDSDAKFEIALEWATDSPYSIGDFGIYVRPPKSGYPLTSFWGVPIAPRTRDGVVYITAYVSDPNPKGPIELDVEIFAINDALQIGPSNTFHLHAPGG